MSHPNLYRAGNTTSPRFDNVREGTDVIVTDGKVGPKSGGISTNSVKVASWAPNKTWVLQRTTALVTGLKAINDAGTHWLIAPASEMTLTTYKSHLRALNAKAVRYDQLQPSDARVEAVELVALSAHSDRATRFIYNALASVVLKSITIADWDENDYAYVAVLARGLEDGSLQLSELVWTEEGGWSKAKAFVARAVSAHMEHEVAAVKLAEDEDAEADAANDHAYLKAVLKLDDAQNPCCAA
ncbi:hypothetical protein K523DRAFT_324667 [Schizophyllum commune Tattone D]|nr:hypothetical protein K525DRAFT_243890 [Schizophyllum commune Loenen D]KAI5824281.1 hypothetical protein K523DRAFT_324667 [Schizophyllum commune Tattone D]